MSKYILEFEKPIKKIEDEIQALKTSCLSTGIDVDDKLNYLYDKLNQEYIKIYSNLKTNSIFSAVIDQHIES